MRCCKAVGRSWGVGLLLFAGLSMSVAKMGYGEIEPSRGAHKRVVLTSSSIKERALPRQAKRKYKKKPCEDMPFYVMNNAVMPAVRNFSISGYMGDVSDLSLAGEYQYPHNEGFPSLRVHYSGLGIAGWAGVIWQNPANNWGECDGGYNLSRAGSLIFWARGNKGGEVVEFLVGGTSANFPDSDSLSTGEIILPDVWTRYVLDLSTAHLDYISAGFGFVLKEESNPGGCTFFLDDIHYKK